MSPTTFPIATLLLGLLFFYDIFFVFYTPLMVTVATNLDVPIKLLFPRPGKTSTGNPALAMLGLGDVVLPGLVIAMALRWDLWRFYEIKHQNLLKAAQEGKGELSKEEEKSLKPRYTKATGAWGLHFWDAHAFGDFPKPYFNASLVGYTAGMLTTLGVMHVFKHAQPALLYLVPGVLISVWGTALAKGEIKAMWEYSEEGEEEEKKKDEDTEKKDEEAKIKGEVDQTILTLKVIRRPAAGAKRMEVKKPKEALFPHLDIPLLPSDIEDEADTDSASENEYEATENDSIGSGEAIDNPERNEMWGTTIIGQRG